MTGIIARLALTAHRRKVGERRAKVINAEGEEQAAQKLLEAARILSQAPEAMGVIAQ